MRPPLRVFAGPRFARREVGAIGITSVSSNEIALVIPIDPTSHDRP